MKTSRHFLLVIFLFIGFNFQNCGDENGIGCECNTVPFFDINGFELIHQEKNSDNFIMQINANDSLSFSSYGFMELNFEVDYISYLRGKSNGFGLGFSTMSSAFGCSCLTSGFSGAKTEGLIDLTIITLNDYNENYLANDTINEIIEFYHDTDLGNPETVDEFISQNSNLIKREFNLFRPTLEPTLSDKFQLKVSISLSNDEKYELTSPEIILIN